MKSKPAPKPATDKVKSTIKSWGDRHRDSLKKGK